MGDETIIIKMIVGVIGVGVLLTVILVPMSFSDLEYYEYGFTRRKSTGAVDSSKVYAMGKHHVGPDFEFKVFQADANFVSLDKVTVFTSDKLEVKLTVRFQYFLRRNDLPLLHKEFDVYYQGIMESSAVDALKGAAPVFSTRQMFDERRNVENALFKAVGERLGGICCAKDCSTFPQACPVDCKPADQCIDTDKGLFADVKYFQLGEVDIPRDVEERFLTALTLQEDAEREKLLQEAQVIRKQTESMVEKIENEANVISQNATSQSELIKTVSQANYTAIIEGARSEGLKNLYTKLGITNQEHKNSFDYLRTLRGIDNVHFTVDFQQRIVGGLG